MREEPLDQVFHRTVLKVEFPRPLPELEAELPVVEQNAERGATFRFTLSLGDQAQ